MPATGGWKSPSPARKRCASRDDDGSSRQLGPRHEEKHSSPHRRLCRGTCSGRAAGPLRAAAGGDRRLAPVRHGSWCAGSPSRSSRSARSAISATPSTRAPSRRRNCAAGVAGAEPGDDSRQLSDAMKDALATLEEGVRQQGRLPLRPALVHHDRPAGHGQDDGAGQFRPELPARQGLQGPPRSRASAARAIATGCSPRKRC